MDARRWAMIESLYDGALSKEPGERSSYLAHECREHPELQAEVESLLRCAEEELNSPLEGSSPTLSLLPDVGFAKAAIDDRYRLLRLIGEGGMGEVWLAEQKKPVRRRVAIKLIKAGMDTREVMARFESERQALALMDHPAIAKVFDAGSTPAGRPYFVMEYVPGIPITHYCDQHKLTVRERLQLFVQVCEGVRHAHQKAIIHRDLKPSNILVTEVDNRPAPKIIDFGIAKAVSQPLTENTFATRLGAFIGTPEYMSPEQADPASDDVDTRADVYSLGVVLYELLAGAAPLDLQKLTVEEMLRKLRSEDAPRPSAKLRVLRDEAVAAAQNRSSEPRALIRQLQGDLDSIVLKALEKERARRYGAPSELAADIEHYLRYEPVSARSAGAGYRAWKYVRRHRIGAAFAATLVFVLVTAVIVSWRIALRATRAEQEATAVSNFFQNDLLRQASVDGQNRSGDKPDPNLTVRTALDRAAARIPGKFADRPLLESYIRRTIGATYYDLSLYPQAEREYKRALELHERILGARNRDTLGTKWSLASIYESAGKLKEAEELMLETLQSQRRILGKEHADTLQSQWDLATIYHKEGRYSEAEALYKDLIPIQQRRLGKDNTDVLGIAADLATLYTDEGKYAQAEPVEREVLDSMLRVRGKGSRDTLAVMGNLAMLYGFEDRFVDSEALYRQAVDGLRRLEGKEDHDTLLETEGLAWASDHLGKYAEADALFSEVLETQTRVLGRDHPETLVTMFDLAASYRRRGKYAEAERLLLQVVDARQRKLGKANPDTVAAIADLGSLYVIEGRYGEAGQLLQGAVQNFEKAPGDDWNRDRVRSALGASLAGQRQYAEAEPLLVNGYQKMLERRTSIPNGKPQLEQAGAWILRLYRDSAQPDKVKEWEQKFKQAGLVVASNGP
jgi:eukaryotic-like serine/threonine-protein kinase